jgi:hypothetical protein
MNGQMPDRPVFRFISWIKHLAFAGRESQQSLPHRPRGRHSGTVPSPADHDDCPVRRWVRQRESLSDDWPMLGRAATRFVTPDQHADAG